ncbi:MAG: preprotein translocase subunit SecE [Arachnia sp.]
MSDKTPDPTGASDREEDALEDTNAIGDPAEADAAAEAPEPTRPEGSQRRRSTSAPVRRDAAGTDGEADDGAIAGLEEDFTPEEQLVAASVRRSSNAPVKKTTSTRKRSESAREDHDPYTAKNPATFVKQSAGEIKKVVWPTWAQLTVLFFAVLVFVLFMIAFVGLLDAGLGALLLRLLGA